MANRKASCSTDS